MGDLLLSMFCEKIEKRVGITPWKTIRLSILSMFCENEKVNENNSLDE